MLLGLSLIKLGNPKVNSDNGLMIGPAESEEQPDSPTLFFETWAKVVLMSLLTKVATWTASEKRTFNLKVETRYSGKGQNN